MRWLGLLALVALGCTKDDAISRDLGAACTSHADCTDVCLPAPAFPNGFCTRMCLGDSDCPPDTACVDTEEGKACLFACNDDRDCDFLDAPEVPDWSCLDFGGGDAGPAVRACGGA